MKIGVYFFNFVFYLTSSLSYWGLSIKQYWKNFYTKSEQTKEFLVCPNWIW